MAPEPFTVGDSQVGGGAFLGWGDESVSVQALALKLKARLETVAAVGKVNHWEPYLLREEDFRTYFLHPDLGYAQGWTITRESTETAFYAMRKSLLAHVMVIRGYRAVDNAASTESAFQDLVESVCVALSAEHLNKLDGLAQAVDPPQVRLVEPRSFGPVEVMHYVEIGLKVAEVAPW